ncbi:N-acetyltransferase [Nakamurella antarctica]|uniref:N-acetyltransferase n=1 Tax=Nakamurella antarctica TaxID=1902245 RepID=A0A3G8ZMC2_9ACTN|nr:GNAT family N-acetyltransferase [Nakamurella antarctica]AZI57995.1 N-acetyltransferase [Nakamurella antarctica]
MSATNNGANLVRADAATSTRLATPADLQGVVDTLVEAFHRDPVWSWAFPDITVRAAQHAAIFQMTVSHAIAHRSVWLTGDYGAVITAFAPGINEMSDDDASRFPAVINELLGDHAQQVNDLFERFEHARPVTTPHLYISMLGVRGRARGHGIGMDLLSHVMQQADSQGIGVYLESSNGANDARYREAGFDIHGSIPVAPGRPPITTMWRDPTPAADLVIYPTLEG